jgi:hypothetical protein
MPALRRRNKLVIPQNLSDPAPDGEVASRLAGRLIRSPLVPGNDNYSLGAIASRARLGGLLNFYSSKPPDCDRYEFSDTTRGEERISLETLQAYTG